MKNLKTSFLVLALGFSVSLLCASVTEAQSSRRTHKSTTTTTTVQTDEAGDDMIDAPAAPVPSIHSNEITESEVSTVFGSQATSGFAGCKTEEQAKTVVKGLKSDCKAWIKDQKSDLGKRYLTSTCEESCADCGTSLQRCSVTGTVRYHKASNP